MECRDVLGGISRVQAHLAKLERHRGAQFSSLPLARALIRLCIRAKQEDARVEAIMWKSAVHSMITRLQGAPRAGSRLARRRNAKTLEVFVSDANRTYARFLHDGALPRARCLVRLGDLARYAGLRGRARRCYRSAVTAGDDTFAAAAHNALGVLDEKEGHPLSAAYRYARGSGRFRVPAGAAQRNLDRTLKAAATEHHGRGAAHDDAGRRSKKMSSLEKRRFGLAFLATLDRLVFSNLRQSHDDAPAEAETGREADAQGHDAAVDASLLLLERALKTNALGAPRWLEAASLCVFAIDAADGLQAAQKQRSVDFGFVFATRLARDSRETALPALVVLCDALTDRTSRRRDDLRDVLGALCSRHPRSDANQPSDVDPGTTALLLGLSERQDLCGFARLYDRPFQSPIDNGRRIDALRALHRGLAAPPNAPQPG
ncbi:hypothetical protein M885DRAFT_524624 [Pelagophyceae sp. CCMP2097]|nr:hypothetical protein M885DRAFT_524624 [Pelagophyceae sp. CCMP2097]